MTGGLPIMFTAPWILLALILLPVLWLILRAIPPAPVKRLFPGVVLLLGLRDDDAVTDRTPWWLLFLRTLALLAVIIGLAGPVLNPSEDSRGDGPLLILMDASWASASDWDARRTMVEALLNEAGRDERVVSLQRLTSPQEVRFQPADIWKSRLAGVVPLPWEPVAVDLQALAAQLEGQKFDTVWLSDGLDRDFRKVLTDTLMAAGSLRVVENGIGILALRPAVFQEGKVALEAQRTELTLQREISVQAFGKDPSGSERLLATLPLVFEAGVSTAENALILPSELRERVSRFEIQGVRSAGAVSLSDDSLQRREVALIAGRDDREGLQLLSPLHYLRKALAQRVDVLEGALLDLLPANPDVVVLADVAVLSKSEEQALLDWIESGGLLLRFAGPRLAASKISRTEEDPLLPVRLRAGGRNVGGAMSWGEPKSLAPFPADSPFFGLQIPDEVTVTAQVMAQPDPTLADRVIASLSDGTPMVTRKVIGQGQVVLMHVTANTEWSGLPLSGLFVQMLDRLAMLNANATDLKDMLAGTVWQPLKVLDGYGRLEDGLSLTGVAGEDLYVGVPGPEILPGLYRDRDRLMALNALSADSVMSAAKWPLSVPVEGLRGAVIKDLSGFLLAVALILLIADVLASLLVSGRLWGTRVAGLFLLVVLLPVPEAQAQNVNAAEHARGLVLAHVLTGDRKVDDTARAGMFGLSETLYFRTSVEPGLPASVDLEQDELAFYPMLYWPISPAQPTPSREAYVKLNDYLRSGGMIVFDTRDADVARFGASSPNGKKLQILAAGLDIPPLDPLPADHVLTRTFYLLQDFPGRYAARDVWVEASSVDPELIEGMPFRNLNDGVTPVVIGGNDWASAWAMDDRGNSLFPVGRGRAGERQRELAYRFGVNLIMYVLTGNYKSDQVHVPALLDRLGQ